MNRLTLGDHFERMVSAVETLHRLNARHKRGFRLRDQPPVKALHHALEELAEVITALAQDDQAAIHDEFGDLLACLLHFAVMESLDLSAVCTQWVQSIPQDFPDTPVPQAPPGAVPVGASPAAGPEPDLWVCFVPETGADFCGENEEMVKQHAAIHNSDDELIRLGGGRVTVRPFYAAPAAGEERAKALREAANVVDTACGEDDDPRGMTCAFRGSKVYHDQGCQREDADALREMADA